MSRREIIIIVAIVNVVLLSVLLVTAQRLEELPPETVTIAGVNTAASLPPAPVNTITPPSEVISEIAVDEVDNVLRDFAAAVAASQQRSQVSTPVVTTKTPLVATPASASGTAYREVVVKRGDFLERIARQQNTSVEIIKQANHLVNDNLKIGQILRIPTTTPLVLEPEVLSPIAADKAVTPSEGQHYRIKSGDSPWKIAKQLHVDVEELLSINGLDEASARNLKPGDIIRVP